MLLAATSHVHCSIRFVSFLKSRVFCAVLDCINIGVLIVFVWEYSKTTLTRQMFGDVQKQLLYDFALYQESTSFLFSGYCFSFLFVVMGLKILKISNVKEFISELMSNLISVMLN